MNINATNVPEEKVSVKISTCSKCEGVVRVAVEHMMDVKMKNEFMREVMKYNLSVRSMPILEYRKGLLEWCSCED